MAVFIFRQVLVPMYRLYFYAKKFLTAVFAPAKNKIIYPLLNKSTVHLVIIFITLAVITNNLYAKEVPAEEFSQKTIVTALTVSEDQTIITETISASTAKNNPNTQPSGLMAANARVEVTAAAEEETDTIMTSESSGAVVNPGLIGTTVGERPRDKIEQYAVEGGDTISTIAEKFGVSVNTVLWANSIGPRDFIKPGQKLTILPQSGVSHEVKKGDTLDQIAKRYSVDANNIIANNKLVDASAIEPGDVLVIPGGTMPEEPKPQTSTQVATRSQVFSILEAPPPSRASSSARLLWPTPSHKINQYYRGSRHSGLDIDGNYSSPIYAADDGRVETADSRARGYGLHIVINNGGGMKTLYAHLSKLFVRPGDSVKRGQTIGIMGCTGWCTGTHLHFEVIISGRKLNPLSYL